MHFLKASAILAFAASAYAQAPTIESVQNHCSETVYITTANSTATGDPEPLLSNEVWQATLSGVGNSLAVSKSDNYWSPSTAKLILGTSISNMILYWSVSSVNGDPMAGETFSIESNGACGAATGYDGQVHACSAPGVGLVLSLCPPS